MNIKYDYLNPTALSIQESGQLGILAGRKGVYVIDLESPSTPVHTFYHHSPWDVSVIQFNPHPQYKDYVASTSNHHTLIWNLASIDHSMSGTTNNNNNGGSPYATLRAHSRPVSDISWSKSDPTFLATCSADSSTHLWDLRQPEKPIQSISTYASSTSAKVQWNPHDGSSLATTHGNEVRVWDTRYLDQSPLLVLTAHMSTIYGLDWHPTRSHEFLTCSEDKSVKCWNVAGGVGNDSHVPMGTLVTSWPVWKAKYTPFGQAIVTLAYRSDNHLRLWSCDYPRAQNVNHTSTGMPKNAAPDTSTNGMSTPAGVAESAVFGAPSSTNNNDVPLTTSPGITETLVNTITGSSHASALHVKIDPVHVYAGLPGYVKDFDWRVISESNSFQLVSLSRKQELKFENIEPQQLKSCGYATILETGKENYDIADEYVNNTSGVLVTEHKMKQPLSSAMNDPSHHSKKRKMRYKIPVICEWDLNDLRNDFVPDMILQDAMPLTLHDFQEYSFLDRFQLHLKQAKETNAEASANAISASSKDGLSESALGSGLLEPKEEDDDDEFLYPGSMGGNNANEENEDETMSGLQTKPLNLAYPLEEAEHEEDLDESDHHWALGGRSRMLKEGVRNFRSVSSASTNTKQNRCLPCPRYSGARYSGNVLVCFNSSSAVAGLQSISKLKSEGVSKPPVNVSKDDRRVYFKNYAQLLLSLRLVNTRSIMNSSNNAFHHSASAANLSALVLDGSQQKLGQPTQPNLANSNAFEIVSSNAMMKNHRSRSSQALSMFGAAEMDDDDDDDDDANLYDMMDNSGGSSSDLSVHGANNYLQGYFSSTRHHLPLNDPNHILISENHQQKISEASSRVNASLSSSSSSSPLFSASIPKSIMSSVPRPPPTHMYHHPRPRRTSITGGLVNTRSMFTFKLVCIDCSDLFCSANEALAYRYMYSKSTPFQSPQNEFQEGSRSLSAQDLFGVLSSLKVPSLFPAAAAGSSVPSLRRSASSGLLDESVYLPAPLPTSPTVVRFPENISQVCQQNAMTAKEAGARETSELWTLMKVITDPRVAHDSSSSKSKSKSIDEQLNPWHAHPCGWSLVHKILNVREAAGDIQTCASIACVLYDSSLKPTMSSSPSNEEKYETSETARVVPRPPSNNHHHATITKSTSYLEFQHLGKSLKTWAGSGDHRQYKSLTREMFVSPVEMARSPIDDPPASLNNSLTPKRPKVRNNENNEEDGRLTIHHDMTKHHYNRRSSDPAPYSARPQAISSSSSSAFTRSLWSSAERDLKRFDRLIKCYGDLLYRWGAMNLRSEILQFQLYPAEFDLSQESAFTFSVTGCTTCPAPSSSQNQNQPSSTSSSSSTYCSSCKDFVIKCSICQLAVRGMTLICMTCGHGGHEHHIRKWFEQETSCATGCGCACLLATSTPVKVVAPADIPTAALHRPPQTTNVSPFSLHAFYPSMLI